MPIDVDNSFIEQKNSISNAPIYLYTIYNYDGNDNNLLLAQWSENITFDSEEYIAFPISHDNIGENSVNETDEVKITLGNVSRLIQSYLEAYDFRGLKVKMTLVWLDEIDNPDVKIDWIYYIDNYTANSLIVTFTLRPKIDMLTVKLPLRIYSRNYCQWKFKSSECGYSGEAQICNKTKQRCKELDNYQRYGGFPSISPKRMYIV